MEFVDNTGHIFSLPSFDEKPIGYEYEEYSYVFWIDTNTSHLSVNNYYSKPIYALYQLQSNFDENNLDIEIYCEKSNVFKLLSSSKLRDYIFSDKYNNLNDYIDLNNLIDNESLVKSRLTNDDLVVYKTTETIERGDKNHKRTSDLDYLLIPIYPIAMCNEEGTWITNIMIHIYDKKINHNEWCYISVGGEFINEYEELIINGKNMGVELPKDILKAVYSESIYNNVFNESLYNEKLKEYMINYMTLRGERGNFNSAIKSLKWFGYGDKISISKLLKTDNNFMSQYINDYFSISNDVIYAFKKFVSDALISLRIMINKETNEQYKFDLTNTFWGENKPKMLSLLDHYEKIKIGNHDMPIEDDDEKYFYYKPYFDFSFIELGIKLMCLKNYYKKYFLPLHLNIHSASLGYKVFMNDIKMTTTIGYNMTQPIVMTNGHSDEVEFTGNGTHYFTKQIHYVDDYFNEYQLLDINTDLRNWYSINDTCVNVPIHFINNGFYNCVLLLENKLTKQLMYESHFSFIQNDSYQYKNFIIYPKKLNVFINKDNKDIKDIHSNYFEYWINKDFTIKLLVNNKWYEYDFELKINNPTLDFGTLRYRYYLNEHNYLINRISKEVNNKDIHSLMFIDESDVDKIKNISNSNDLISNANASKNINLINELLYETLNLNTNKSFIKTFDISNENIYQYLESNYDILSPFKQINKMVNNKISFNAYMHNAELVNVNNIDFDIDFYKILKYHLDRNLMYIDGTLINNDFYQYIIYEKNNNKYEIVIQKDLIGFDLNIPEEYLYKYSQILVCAYNDVLYILTETGDSNESYYINNIRDVRNSIILSEMIDENDNPVALIFDSLNLQYDKLSNSYYEIKNGKKIDYPIYDKLYSNVEYIHEKYTANIKLPNISKYKNSLHLFNLYTEETEYVNILLFHNDINIYLKGLHIEHKKYNQYDDDSLKFTIKGNLINTNDEYSKYVDVYGLHWISDQNITINTDGTIEHIQNVPVEIIDTLNQYGIYVKRDYRKYYDTKEINNIYELNNIEEYDVNEFTYYTSEKNSCLGYNVYRTLNDFYQNNILESETNGANVFINVEDNKKYFYFKDFDTRDLTDLSKMYINKLSYKLIFYNDNDEVIEDISLNNLNNVDYAYIKVEFYYHKKYIVRNRFYLLSEFISLNNDKNIYVDTNNKTIQINGVDYSIIKINNKFTYYDKDYNHIIVNQNPSMYWYNLDNNEINSLPEYLNELERYTYDNKTESFKDIISKLEEYKTMFENKTLDDADVVRYNYVNYLSKDLTGLVGEYVLKIEQINYSKKIRLCMDVIKNDTITTYISNDNNKVILDGTEDKVTLYIQFIQNFELDNNASMWFIPKLLKVIKTDKPLEYNAEECGNEISVNFLNKEYKYGDNSSKFVYDLYQKFFKLKFNIYDNYIKDNKMYTYLLNSVYDCRDELKLNTYLNYDFYLMHDDKYWYCLYISQQTIDNISKQTDLKLPNEYKELSFIDNDIKYKLKYSRSSEEYLMNRLEFISSNGYNHFKEDDIICCYMFNNDRLPFNPYISSKWSVKPMSIGSKNDSSFDSSAELTILSIPSSMNKYEKGYYKINVKYSLDRDVQHQFKNTSTILIS